MILYSSSPFLDMDWTTDTFYELSEKKIKKISRKRLTVHKKKVYSINNLKGQINLWRSFYEKKTIK